MVLEAEAAWMWHALNAYERDGRIVADFVGYDDPNHFLGDDPLLWTIMSGRVGDNAPGTLRRYVIDLERREVQSEVLAGDGSYEFPIVNPRRSCHEHRYGYLARRGSDDVFWREVARVDTEGGATERYDFGEGVYVTEPVFVPASGTATGETTDEPGWLLTEGYDGRRQKGFLAVLRAERVADGPVALVHLRHHVPFNFHGWWHPQA